MTQSTVTPDAEALSIAHACEPPTVDPEGPRLRGRGPGSRRLTGIDAARGLALLGMMAVHILPAYTADLDLTMPWSVAVGKSAALFAVIAGLGIAMTTGRRHLLVGRKYAAESSSLVVRAVLIGSLGLLLGVLVPNEAFIILPYYAILFVLAIPLLRLSRRWLVACTTVIAIGVPVASHFWRAQNPDRVVGIFNPTFGDLLSEPGQVLSLVLISGAYPALAWVAYICAGLAVGRGDLRRRSSVAKMMFLGIAMALAANAMAWLALNAAGGRAAIDTANDAASSPVDVEDILTAGADGIIPTNTLWWLAINGPHTTTPLDIFHTIGIALAVLGAMILLGRVAGRLLKPLNAIGSMPLTMYAVHLLLLVQPWMPENTTAEYGIQLLILTVIALVWTRFFRRGPLEQIVRSISNAVSLRRR